jgi:hypothetical protein
VLWQHQTFAADIRFASPVDRYILFGPELFDGVVSEFRRRRDDNIVNRVCLSHTTNNVCKNVVTIKR